MNDPNPEMTGSAGNPSGPDPSADALLLSQIAERLERLETVENFMRQQVSWMVTAVQSGFQGQDALLKELKRFQTGGAQHAMSALTFRFFRDVLEVVNDLDNLLVLDPAVTYTERERAWFAALDTLRSRFDNILAGWGCVPVPIIPGETDFDPEIHESVEGDVPVGTPENRIVKVQRRGWMLHDTIVQYPQVVVG